MTRPPTCRCRFSRRYSQPGIDPNCPVHAIGTPPALGSTRRGRVYDRNGKTVREFTEEYIRLENGRMAWRPTTMVRVRIHSGERVEVYR